MIECSPGKIYENRTCVPILEQGTYLRYNLFFGMSATLTGAVPKWYSILRKLKLKILSFLSRKFKIDYAYYYLTSNLPCDFHVDNETHKIVVGKAMYQTSFVITSEVDRMETEKTLLALRNRVFNVKVKDTLFTFYGRPDTDAFYVSSQIGILKSDWMCYIFKHFPLESSVLSEYVPMFEIVSDVMTCKQIAITTDYTTSPRTRQVYVTYLERSYDVDEYIHDDDGAIHVCISNYNTNNESQTEIGTSNIDMALKIFTILCTCSSLVALLLSFVTYMLFRVLRTLPGKNNICLIVALFAAQATFHFGIDRTENRKLCIALGMVSHYFWLATFFCMVVCCYHMFLAFDTKYMTSFSKRDSNSVVRRYCLFSFGTPLLIIILNSGITAAVREGDFLGYGPEYCFITNIYVMGFAFVLPLLVCTVANVVFFTTTLRNIHSSPKIQSTGGNRRHIVIYIKLFSLTGLTWILQLIDSNLDISAFSFLATFFNSCQGVFIFLSYICNKRIASLYKLLVLRHRKKETRSNITTYSKETHFMNTQSSTD